MPIYKTKKGYKIANTPGYSKREAALKTERLTKKEGKNEEL